jgi:toxin FitB
MYLIDTNVISEMRKARAGKIDLNVARWASGVDVNQMFVSVITIHEIEIGTLLTERRDLAQGRIYRSWLENDVLPTFASRMLPVNVEVARVCAAYHVPDPMPLLDSFIAATAQVHGLTLVTRNTADFQRCGIPLLNPWH